MMKKSIVFLLFMALLASCKGQTTSGPITLSSSAFAEKLKEKGTTQLIDVRTPEEYATDHLENAQNINLFDADFNGKIAKLDKSKPVFVYCKVGGRSAQAANRLTALGFTEIYNLEGGIMRWEGAKVAKAVSGTVGIAEADYNKLIAATPKVVINFSAKWCAPCKKMEPYILKMQNELQGNMSLKRLDYDENKTVADKLNAKNLPVVIIYENGKEVWRHEGYLSEEELRKQLGI